MISFSGQKRIEQLASQCTFLNTHQCDEEGTYCSYDYQVCDGVANCFKAEDEDLDTCINANLFSELATIECLKADIENLEIKIRAVPCDGKRECKHGEDEDQCSLPDFILIVTLVCLVVINFILTLVLWKVTIEDYDLLKENETKTKAELNALHGTTHLKTVMFQMQHSTHVELINQRYFDMELDWHSRHFGEVVCCMKVMLTLLTGSH